MNSKKNKNNLILLILTPIIILMICVGVLLVAMIKPYNKASLYLNLAFMDSLKSNPNDQSSGLIIKDSDIVLDYNGKTSDTGELIRPIYGEQFAILRSDGFELSVPVYWGSSSELLDRGACHASNSVLPGDTGNAVISAHEDTFFSDLDKLEIGNTITINTNYGEFVYTVKEKISFKKKNKKYVIPTEDTRLTLYTCKKDILGASDERIGVICELTTKTFYVTTEEVSEN